MKSARKKEAMISTLHNGSMTEIFPRFNDSNSSNAANNKNKEAKVKIRTICLEAIEKRLEYTNGVRMTAPNEAMKKRVSQSPNFLVDLWIRKSPKPQKRNAHNAKIIPMLSSIFLY